MESAGLPKYGPFERIPVTNWGPEASSTDPKVVFGDLQGEKRMKIVEISEVAPTCHSNVKLVETAEVAPTCHNSVRLVESTEVAPTCH